MLFSRKSLGLEIGSSGVAFALLGGSVTSPRLERVSYRPFDPGVIRTSLREQNILDTDAFIRNVKDAYNTLLHHGPRISVTLPDTVGHILLLDMEGRFKSRSEGIDMIRWKLKKNIPFDVADTHLDYQQLSIRENGDMALLVALVSRRVMGQYEESLVAAGLVPSRIDFNSFNLYRTFEQRLASLEQCALVSYFDNILGIMIFSNGIPEFVRVKELAGTPAVDSRVFMEITNSFLVHHERFPERVMQNIACIAPPDVSTGFCDMVAEATGSTPVLLEAKAAVTPSDEAPADQASLFPFTAAIGSALRSL